MNEHLKTLSLLLTAYLPKVAAAGIVFFAGRWLANWVARIVARLLETNGVEPTLVKFLRPVIFNALLIVVLITSLRQLGVDTSSFLTVIGAAGLAVGL
ncbi:MAG: mechanosensitive ion channel family protein, partial [Desulfobacteraceae bacterium]|nr:mechanosensitive ion channel family protein [Desulfobacteraceae bacterium]